MSWADVVAKVNADSLSQFKEEAWALYNGSDNKSVIFDEDYAVTRMVDGIEISSTIPMAYGLVSDFPSLAQGDTLVINSTTYEVDEFQPDGHGFVGMVLQKV